MAVQRIGDFLREVLPKYADKTIVVIGHTATKYGIEYWSGERTLEDVVKTPWQWLAVPIWRYMFDNPLKRLK